MPIYFFVLFLIFHFNLFFPFFLPSLLAESFCGKFWRMRYFLKLKNVYVLTLFFRDKILFILAIRFEEFSYGFKFILECEKSCLKNLRCYGLTLINLNSMLFHPQQCRISFYLFTADEEGNVHRLKWWLDRIWDQLLPFQIQIHWAQNSHPLEFFHSNTFNKYTYIDPTIENFKPSIRNIPNDLSIFALAIRENNNDRGQILKFLQNEQFTQASSAADI